MHIKEKSTGVFKQFLVEMDTSKDQWVHMASLPPLLAFN